MRGDLAVAPPELVQRLAGPFELLPVPIALFVVADHVPLAVIGRLVGFGDLALQLGDRLDLVRVSRRQLAGDVGDRQIAPAGGHTIGHRLALQLRDIDPLAFGALQEGAPAVQRAG